MVETVFSWPGLGQLAAEAIGSADAPLAMASVLLGALTATCGGVLTSLGADRNRPQRGQS
jgi:ABC-type dipeptide/oligopeptide/nickel transport system permease component